MPAHPAHGPSSCPQADSPVGSVWTSWQAYLPRETTSPAKIRASMIIYRPRTKGGKGSRRRKVFYGKVHTCTVRAPDGKVRDRYCRKTKSPAFLTGGAVGPCRRHMCTISPPPPLRLQVHALTSIRCCAFRARKDLQETSKNVAAGLSCHLHRPSKLRLPLAKCQPRQNTTAGAEWGGRWSPPPPSFPRCCSSLLVP